VTIEHSAYRNPQAWKRPERHVRDGAWLMICQGARHLIANHGPTFIISTALFLLTSLPMATDDKLLTIS